MEILEYRQIQKAIKLVVGAQDQSGGASYVFDYDGTNWVETILTASDGASGDKFGAAVGLNADRIIVGSIYDQDNGLFSGSAYVFECDGTSWVETEKLLPSIGGEEDLL